MCCKKKKNHLSFQLDKNTFNLTKANINLIDTEQQVRILEGFLYVLRKHEDFFFSDHAHKFGLFPFKGDTNSYQIQRDVFQVDISPFKNGDLIMTYGMNSPEQIDLFYEVVLIKDQGRY